jgi:hypothetical protein
MRVIFLSKCGMTELYNSSNGTINNNFIKMKELKTKIQNAIVLFWEEDNEEKATEAIMKLFKEELEKQVTLADDGRSLPFEISVNFEGRNIVKIETTDPRTKITRVSKSDGLDMFIKDVNITVMR